MRDPGYRNVVVAAAFLGASALLAAGCGEEGRLQPAEPSASKPQLMTQDEVCTADTDAACTPTGAHARHGSLACTVCHKVAGRLVFDSSGPAYAGWSSARPRPSFDATAKTCSNVACHGMPAGTFSYWFMGGDGEAVLNTVAYGGGAPRPTPSWYSSGAGCAACHDDPPRSGSTGSNVWHSGYHGNQGPTGARNQCQFCHPGAYSPNDGIGTSNSNQHNGVVEVQATFTGACFGCH